MGVSGRNAAHEIDPVFLNRWSRRALSGEPIDLDLLFRLFEAARWAPSARNVQPWRFLYAQRDGLHWPAFLELVYDRNRVWAQHAAALVAILSQRTYDVDGVETPLRTHAFDAGAAWANLALQASLLDLSARAMGGVDLERARSVLALPETVEIHVIVAIGRPASERALPDHLQALEEPNQRKPQSSFVFEGSFPA